MTLLQISSAQGPVECCEAVALALQQILREAHKMNVETALVEEMPGPVTGTYRSVIISLDGENTLNLVQRWCGTVQWICPSRWRPGHKRKNWFIGISKVDADMPAALDNNEIVFESMRSSGPGGQHVNTTETAIRATHVSTGISVRVQSERSQYANKRLARLLLEHKLREFKASLHQQHRSAGRLQHYYIERGNPVLTFKGEDFKEI